MESENFDIREKKKNERRNENWRNNEERKNRMRKEEEGMRERE
jgi:hypothetical protein